MAGWMLLFWASQARASIEVEASPKEAVETVILVTDELGDPASGETVRVVHRPGLAGERELAIGITDGRGRVRWKPEQEGLALLRAGEQTTKLHIEAHSPPITSLVLLGLLVTAGLGASLYGLLGRRGR